MCTLYDNNISLNDCLYLYMGEGNEIYLKKCYLHKPSVNVNSVQQQNNRLIVKCH
jgi:hypothetical protein